MLTVARRYMMLTPHSAMACESRIFSAIWAIHPTPWPVSTRAKGSIAAWTTATIPTAASATRVRADHSSQTASGATRKAAKKWVMSASEDHSAHPARFRRVGRRRALMNHRNEAPDSAASSMYARASCEYQIRNGLKVTSAAATTPARALTKSRADKYEIGTTATPATSDTERSATSPLPNTCAQAQISTK